MTSLPQQQPSPSRFVELSENECTSPVGALSGLARRTSVAFEIDMLDERNQSGCSVLVLGFAEAMVHNYLLASAWETGPVPWADGTRNLFIEIKPRKISGRSVPTRSDY